MKALVSSFIWVKKDGSCSKVRSPLKIDKHFGVSDEKCACLGMAFVLPTPVLKKACMLENNYRCDCISEGVISGPLPGKRSGWLIGIYYYNLRLERTIDWFRAGDTLASWGKMHLEGFTLEFSWVNKMVTACSLTFFIDSCENRTM